MDTYVVAKKPDGSKGAIDHEKFIHDVLIPTVRKLDKRLKSIRYLSCVAGQDISSYGGRMLIWEYKSMADWEKSGKELEKNAEANKVNFRFAQLIDTSSHRASFWVEGSHGMYEIKKKR